NVGCPGGGATLSPCGRGWIGQRPGRVRGLRKGKLTPHPARFARHPLPQGERVFELVATLRWDQRGFWNFSTNSSTGTFEPKIRSSRVSSGWWRKLPSSISLKPAASTSDFNVASSI